MNKEHFSISSEEYCIPAVLWGEASSKLLIAVHGNLSNKEDTVISILAEEAVKKGYQVLSFDLPKHGERINEDYACNPPNCVRDLIAVYEYAKLTAAEISLFACSMGAYFSLLAYHDLALEQSLFLSPVVNMERIINNMMDGFHITAERLRAEQEIKLPIGETLIWDYYQYVRAHPICFDWNMPTAILYGSDDNLSEFSEISAFAARYQAEVRIIEHGEHFFHTEKQLQAFELWVSDSLL